jgi:hypothetical protein
MAEIDNENQEDDSSGEEDRSFGQVEEREEDSDSDEGEGSEAAGDTGDEGSDDAAGEEDQDGDAEEDGKPEKDAKAGKDDKPELSEKGTKLDPNPLSRAHQELANEKKTRSQMEQVLANPDLLAKFMETQYGIRVNAQPAKADEAKTNEPEFKEFTAADFENLDDVAKVVNGIQKSAFEKTKSLESQVKELSSTVTNLLQGGNAQRLYTTMSEEVSTLSKEPELDPTSPEYIDGLEGDISSMYHRLDFDEKTQTYRGQYSLAEVGKSIISAARKARQKGSQRAQTVVKNKSEGKVRTSTQVKDNAGKDENVSAGNSIASGVAKLFG